VSDDRWPAVASGVVGLLSRAELAARKRGHAPTTQHLLLALAREASAGPVLASWGVDEAALVGGFTGHDPEPEPTLRLVAERASRLLSDPTWGDMKAGLALLLCLSREPRTAAYRSLERLGLSPAQLRASLESVLSGESRQHFDADVDARGAGRGDRLRADERLAQQSARLAAQTEARARKLRVRPRGVVEPVEAEVLRAGCEGAELAADDAPAGPTPAAALGTPAGIDGLELDPARFPLLTSLGRNLSAAAAAGQLDRVYGRQREIEQLLDVLARRRSNNPILVGPPGVGKTALIEGLASQLLLEPQGPRPSPLLIELPPAALVSGTGVRGALSERLAAVIAEVADAAGSVVLFIDEIHSLVGDDDGPDSIATGLKAALARGQLPCIGATTDAEYRTSFERDPALARRFSRIDVEAPDPEACLEILRAVAPTYELHHGLPIEAAAIEAAIAMSVRYLPEQQLPDKAIGLLDQAAARSRRRGGRRVDLAAVAEVVSERAAIPCDRLLMRDGEALLALESHLHERIVGQDEAIAAVCETLRKGAAGFRGERPLGTFLFLGPTGVGKTELAKAISELLFPGAEPTRIDMSELSEAHAVARLIGAPPGYLGHDSGGQLTEAVRGRPYQLLLLDEVEKAHREVLLSLLPLLDEGRLTDGRGRTVDFRNTVIVMTSNLGAGHSDAPRRAPIGFGGGGEVQEGESRAQRREAVLQAARQALPPELFNRIDEPLCFHPLSRQEVAEIAEAMVARCVVQLERQHGIELDVEPSTIDSLLDAGGYDHQLGARPMRRTVGRLLESGLARAILSGEAARGDLLRVRGQGQRLLIERADRTLDAAE